MVSGGFVSCAHWLAWRTGDDLITAREKVRVARALEQLPLISAAFSVAKLSYSKVRAMTRVATSQNEVQLLVMGAEGTASQMERIVRGFRRAQPLELDAAQAQHENRTLQYYYNEHGMLELRVRLPPEAGALLIKALEAAFDALKEKAHSEDDAEDDRNTTCIEEISPCQRQADAMVLLAESALDHNLARGPRAERYQVVVHVDAEALKSPPLSENERVANGQVATQKNSAESSITENLPASHASNEQVATAKNSAESWFQSELENGSLLFFHPNGTLLPSSPPPHLLDHNPIQRLVEDHRAAGMTITDQTGGPTEWTGMPFDLGDAVSTILPAEKQELPLANELTLENEHPLETECPPEDHHLNIHAA